MTAFATTAAITYTVKGMIGGHRVSSVREGVGGVAGVRFVGVELAGALVAVTGGRPIGAVPIDVVCIRAVMPIDVVSIRAVVPIVAAVEGTGYESVGGA
ncbi:MAG TPA: hypothetical protein VFV66_35555 [Nonomuraea sp.]|nr:hypothetical protein [Nonomuraea sp.]